MIMPSDGSKAPLRFKHESGSSRAIFIRYQKRQYSEDQIPHR